MDSFEITGQATCTSNAVEYNNNTKEKEKETTNILTIASYYTKIKEKPNRYFSLIESEAIKEINDRNNVTHTSVFKADFGLHFKPIFNDFLWCFECFTTNPDEGEDGFRLHETVCSHIFCEDCIVSLLKDAVNMKKNLICPLCKINLLNLF